jgi:hypothetical protein
MTSVLRFIKQRPSESQYFISLLANPTLSVFVADAQNPTQTYVSGAAAGFFSSSVATTASDVSNAAINVLFRDMGVTIVSSLRTFRRVQLLNLDLGQAAPGPNFQGVEWSSQGGTGAGVFQQGASTEGVTGTQVVASSNADSSFNVFYFETGANGLGVAQGLIRYG